MWWIDAIKDAYETLIPNHVGIMPTESKLCLQLCTFLCTSFFTNFYTYL